MLNFKLLEPQDIEVKVKQVTKTGALLLLYKTARTDAKILDEVVGPLNWTDSYCEVKGNLYCSVGIRESGTSDFVYKMDCGIESGQDDGQEKKAEASDAFKRCCTKWGIGRELYTSPQIWASVATVQKGDKWFLEDKYAKYIVTEIKYDEKNRVITALQICNAKTGVAVFEWELPTNEAMKKKMNRTFEDVDSESGVSSEEAKEPVADTKEPEKEVAETPKKTKSKTTQKKPLQELVEAVGGMVKFMYETEGNSSAFQAIVNDIQPGFKCKAATEEDYDTVLKIYNKLVEGGYNG